MPADYNRGLTTVQPGRSPLLTAAADQLVLAGRRFDTRGWVMGTSGNFSVVVSPRPLKLLMTPSGAHKGRLKASDLLVVDGQGHAKSGARKPSAETLLHLEIVRGRGAGAVLHTHSVWSTILSERHAHAGGLAIEGYEMLKGLSGVETHEHTEKVPIVENSQDYIALAHVIENVIRENAGIHGIYLRRHGLYTWGETVAEARRHVEIFEFLFEVLGRQKT